MAEPAPPASLPTLPPEILGMIILNPIFAGHIRIQDSAPDSKNRWLPFGYTRTHVYHVNEGHVNRLRSLSQVCQSLREFTLPLLWAAVHISSVEELGFLREILRISPSHARHIRSFSFQWTMGGDAELYNECDSRASFAPKDLTLLQLAFRNRLAMWDDLRRQLRCEIKHDYNLVGRSGLGAVRLSFEHENVKYKAPVRYEHRTDNWDGRSRYQQVGGNGPDGEGRGRRIKSPKGLIECLEEVVVKLKSVQSFGWGSPVLSMPSAIFNALAALPTLTSLHLDMSSLRTNLHTLPLWELAGNLTSLSFDFGEFASIPRDKSNQEHFEATVASAQYCPKTPYECQSQREDFHASLASRILISAAKGGKLRRFRSNAIQTTPFAVRSLVSYWVHIEDWGPAKKGTWGAQTWKGGWPGAAASVRSLLAHISLWLGTNNSSARDDRHLTYQELQALQESLTGDDMPRFCPEHASDEQPVRRYLAWLAQDEELARKVADAWNEVVKRGEADKVKCLCERCKLFYAAAKIGRSRRETGTRGGY